MIDTGCLPIVEDVAWIRVDDSSAPGRARRVAGSLAGQLEFSEIRVAEVELAITELGTNLWKHARRGRLVVRSVRAITQAAVEVVSIDDGPGIADVTDALRDGQSSTGTLGVGLGAVARLANTLEVASEVGVGTVVTARFHPARDPLPELDAAPAAGITRPFDGEELCGDAYAVRRFDGRTQLMMCDGSGHGPLAATASQAAVRAFCEHTTQGPEDLIAHIHERLRGTRGGAVAVAELNHATESVRFAGLGNISGSIVVGDQKRGMVSVPGIAGYRARTIRGFDYPLPAGATVVLHSDGLTERWSPEGKARAFTASPLLIAAALIRDAGVRADDAGVLVYRAPAP